MSVQRKNIVALVYAPDGTYLATWSAMQFASFTKELNAGPSECVLSLPVAFDYAGVDLSLANEVEIRISDKDTVAQGGLDASRTIYRGYISLIDRVVDGQKETVTVHMLGFYTRLSLDLLKNGSQTSLYSKTSGYLTATLADISAADIGGMMRAVLDRYIAETSNPKISYTPDGIPLTGTTAEYTFEQMKYRDAMDKLKTMAPVGTYYYVDENGVVTFGPKPTTPTHKFVFGRHFTRVEIQQNMETVRNGLLVWNGEPTSGGLDIYNHYEDAASIASYGRRVETENDYGIGTDDAADLEGAKFLGENKDPEIKLTCTIIDNNETENWGYDIESIQPGNTCSLYGFNNALSGVFQDNMLITKVTYYLDRAEIEVQTVKSGLQDFQDQQGKQIAQLQSGGFKVPESYT